MVIPCGCWRTWCEVNRDEVHLFINEDLQLWGGNNSQTYQVTCHDLMAVVAIVVTVVNIFEVGISKIEPACGVVQGQAVGPVELSTDNDSSHGSVHTGTLDPGVLTPVRPEHQVGAERDDNAIRMYM